jgi:DNA-binding transcriptional ArsR family regulator
MDADDSIDAAVSAIAAAIGEQARASMLYNLMDGRARTSTELAVIAGVSPSTASIHLQRLLATRLVRVYVQGKHRYYSLEGSNVARVLEGLSVLAGNPRAPFVSRAPRSLCAARTCYDHLAGTLGVALHNRFHALGWLSAHPARATRKNSAKSLAKNTGAYDLSEAGERALAAFGIDIQATRNLRRQFACPCLDWSERQPHIGGALGAALLAVILKKKWLTQDLDSRALSVSSLGRREMQSRFGLQI